MRGFSLRLIMYTLVFSSWKGNGGLAPSSWKMPENTVFCGISSYIALDEILFLVCYFYMHSFYY